MRTIVRANRETKRATFDPKQPRGAVIVETPTRDNGWFFVVHTDDGAVYHLAGLGAPAGGKVGDRGTVAYQSGASFGLYFWAPEVK